MTIVKEIVEHFSAYPVFTYRDLKLYFKSEKIKPENLSRLLSYMKSSGRLHTLRNGAYTFKEDDMVAGFAYAPFYYGMLSALTIRGLWTQQSRPDIITVKRVRTVSRFVFGDRERRVFVHHSPAKYFFGFDIIKDGKLRVPVSDPEKTLIDLFYYRTKLAIQNYSGLLQAINTAKVRRYLKNYDRHTSVAVINFVKKYKKLADEGKLETGY